MFLRLRHEREIDPDVAPYPDDVFAPTLRSLRSLASQLSNPFGVHVASRGILVSVTQPVRKCEAITSMEG